MDINQVYEYVLIDVYTKLSKNLKDKYITLVLKEDIIECSDEDSDVQKAYLQQQNKIKQYINEIINTELWDKNSDEILRIKKITSENRSKTKLRWVAKIKEEISAYVANNELVDEFSISGELELAKRNLEVFGVAKFKDLYGVSSIDELIQLKTEQIETWKRNDDVIMFPYIANKLQYQIDSAVRADFLYHIVTIAVSDYDANFKSAVAERPHTLDMYPIFSAEPQGELLTLEEQYDGQLFFNDYAVTDNLTLRTIIGKSQEGCLSVSKPYSFDHRDSVLLDYIFAKKDEQFITKKLITVDIGDAVKCVCKSKSADSYKDIEQRIIKIADYKLQGIIKENNNEDSLFSLNLFEKAFIRTDPSTKKRYATIVLSDTLHQEIIEGNVSFFYYRQVKLLENPTSRVITYPLQKERLQHCTETIGYRGKYDYSFFRQHIRFRSKRKTTNMKLIEASLQEFIDKQLLISQFETLPDGFEIEFTPVPEFERADLMKKSIINKKNLIL